MKTAEEVFPPRVLAYLDSTRFYIPNPAAKESAAILDALYDPFINYLRFVGDIFDVHTNVGLVYTDMMRSEAITSEQSSFIVHDQYFGQVINMMNRMFIYNSSKITKHIYFHKIASQILSRYGFYKESIFAADKYRGSRDKMDHKDRQKDDGSQLHGLYTAVQELLVLLHEQAHIIFKRCPELLSEASSDARAWLDTFGGKGEKISDAELEFVLKGLSEEEQRYFIEHLEKFDQSQRLASKFCGEISSRQDLIEELCCDRIALTHVLGYFSSGRFSILGEKGFREYDTGDKVKAILLCFLNMRTLQSMEAMCSLEKNADFPARNKTLSAAEGIYSTFYNARLHHAKMLCYEYVLKDDDDVQAIHAMVTKFMDCHTDEIYSPAMSTMQHLLYEPNLRAEIESVFEKFEPIIADDQHFKRKLTALFHLFPEP
jgi:hypothetical protein